MAGRISFLYFREAENKIRKKKCSGHNKQDLEKCEKTPERRDVNRFSIEF
jgi:hypothetical protein